MSIQTTVNDFTAEFGTLKQHYFIFIGGVSEWSLLHLNGGGGTMMDISAVTGERDV